MNEPLLIRPDTLDAALGELDALGGEGALLAGGTWVMRAPQRREPFAKAYVSLARLSELTGISTGERTSLGALLTHAELGTLEAGSGPLGALAQAARTSAFPAVRSVATLGGNLCAAGFAESDLAPALLALDAEVELASGAGPERLPLDAYLETRPPGIVARVHVPCPPNRRSAYRRLTVLGGGEYPVCGVAVAFGLEGDTIRSARVAATAVDRRPRLLPDAAAALEGVGPADEAAVLGAGRAGAAELPERDGLDAPGWYRLAVLPPLLRDAVAAAAGGAS